MSLFLSQNVYSSNIIRVLTIGNSFSEDAVENYLYELGKEKGITIVIGNLYYAAGSLGDHAAFAANGYTSYSFRKIAANGTKTTTYSTTLLHGITNEPWDYISIQQNSANSGLFASYQPHLTNLLNCIKLNTTNNAVKYIFHQTWAYAQNSTHPGFISYNNDQTTMYNAIINAATQVEQGDYVDLIVPNATAIQNGRTSVLGDTFCRDGYHLDYGIGRFTAACTWYEVLTGLSVIDNAYKPSVLSTTEANIAKSAAHNAVLQPTEITTIDISFPPIQALISPVKIDFGYNNAADPVWNIFSSHATGSYMNYLRNANISETPIKLLIATGFTGTNSNGPSSTSTVLNMHGNVSYDSFYSDGLNLAQGVIEIQNLHVYSPHKFTFFGSRAGVSDNRETVYEVVGNNKNSAALNPSGNTTAVALVSGIYPKSDGSVSIIVKPGVNNNNSNKYYYINALQIESEVLMPVVGTTNETTQIAATSALSGGVVDFDGGALVTERGVCWSVSENPTVSDSKTTDGTGTGSFSSLLTDLLPNTTYYVRSYATNCVGTCYGAMQSFTTLNEFTVVETKTLSSYLKINSLSSLIIPNGSTLIVDNNATLAGITVEAGGKLTLSAGTLSVNNGITLESDATGTATIVGNATYTGELTAKQYLGSARNWYISSPVQGANSPANNILSYYEYVEAGNNDYPKDGNNIADNYGETNYWKYWMNGHNMSVGKGYIARANTETTVQFVGVPNFGDITTDFDLTRNVSKGKGFNLAGNPYPSYLDWNEVANANPNLSKTFYFRSKNTNSNSQYLFVSFNGLLNTYVSSNGAANTTITRFIPPTQAFWVRVNEGISTTKMHFNNNMRAHRDNSNNLLKLPQQNSRTSLRLHLKNNEYSDEALICTDLNAFNSFDVYDSPKMMNNSKTIPDIYCKVDTERLVINAMNTIPDNTELVLGFGLNSAAKLQLRVAEMNNFPYGAKVYLLDKVKNYQIELSHELHYDFDISDANINNESRFSLLFKMPDFSTLSYTDINENVNVFVNNLNQIVINSNLDAKCLIFNIYGRLVNSEYVKSNRQLIVSESTFETSLNSGIYLVKVISDGFASCHKVIVR